MIFVNPNAGGLPIPLDESMTSGVMSRRVIGWLLDTMLLALICSGLWMFCVAFGVLTLGLGWPLFGVLPAVPVLYQWLFLASHMSATPGQAMMGLAVRRNEDLGRPTPAQALAFTLLFYLTLALGWFWVAVALVTERHRTFHDIFSGLVVIRTRALTQRSGVWNMGSGGPSPA